MLPESKTKTNIGVGVGLILEFAGNYIYARTHSALGPLLTLVGAVLFIWGCINYAEGKGYSKWLGLLGLLSCIGLVVLVVLPDKNK